MDQELDYQELVKNPDFLKALQGAGWKKADEDEPVYEGKITLDDKIERTLNYDFPTVAFLKLMMVANEIPELDPLNNLGHFSLLLYVMCVQDMIDRETTLPKESFCKFEYFVEQIPTDAKSIEKLMRVMVAVIERNKKSLVVK